MQIHITSASDLPIYRQIMRQIVDAVAGDRLRPGDKLTSQRELAEQLVVSPLTVKKAYDELEREGLIQTQRGRGTFVAARATAVDPAAQRQRLREMVRRLLSRAHLGGLDFTSVLALAHEVHAELEAERAAEGGSDNDESGSTPRESESES